MRIDIANLQDIPLYNEDVREAGFPVAVQRLRQEVASADALLFCTPEYNYSVSGVLKNFIDWMSRPPERPFIGKPAAIIGASPSAQGTVRAQTHLRQICTLLDMHVLNKPEVLIASAKEKFDAEGRLSDEPMRQKIREILIALRDWTRRLDARADSPHE